MNATTDCPYNQCDGSGFSQIEDTHYFYLSREEQLKAGGSIIQKECKCYVSLTKHRELEKTLKISGIPEKFKDALISNFSISVYETRETQEAAAYAKKTAVNFVKRYEEVKEMGKGLYLFSKIKGSGKTRLAISIGNALLKKYGVVPLYKTTEGMFDEIKSTFDSDKSTTVVVDTFRNADLLILDDIGVEESRKGNTGWRERMMTELLDYRMTNNRLTLFTSNVQIQELDKETLYPEGRVQSRINKMAFEIHMPEESVRDSEAESENQTFEQMLIGEE